MRALPLSIGVIHFCGVGGIGMSGIAEVLHNLGYSVQGSDIDKNNNVVRLADLGIIIQIGHFAENIEKAAVVVVSSAIKKDNPELVEARRRQLPIIKRAEMLAELMRLKRAIAVGGTHGKTTTTSLIASTLETAGIDPTVINGGIINAYGTNARLGAGEWIVVEADESDGTFVKLPATIAVITNIDPEHLDFFGSFNNLKKAFTSFIENIPFYGLAVLCVDHSEIQALLPQISGKKFITYGMSPLADIRAENLRLMEDHTIFDIVFSGRSNIAGKRLNDVFLPMVGKHNAQNALVAAAIAQELEISTETLKKGLAEFSGIKRRFTVTGKTNGISIIDDYGHHPTEISAVLAAARTIARGGVIAVFQPHRFSRVKNLFEEFCTCFNDADFVVVGDVYAAGETAIEGIDRESIVKGLQAHGHRNVVSLNHEKELPDLIAKIANNNDMVICLGAGSITNWANQLPDELTKIFNKNKKLQACPS